MTNFTPLEHCLKYCFNSQDTVWIQKYRLRGGLQVLLDKYLPLEQNKEMISILGQLSMVCTKNAGLGKTVIFWKFFHEDEDVKYLDITGK